MRCALARVRCKINRQRPVQRHHNCFCYEFDRKQRRAVVANILPLDQQQKLQALSPTDLPSPPQSALLIMRACSNENIEHKDLSNLVSSDPVIAAELLRVVNSAYFGLSREVKSLVRAIGILGQRELRNLVLCLSVRDLVNKISLPNFNIDSFWEEILRRAASAKILAGYVGMQPDDCFTVGMLQEFGLLALFYLNPQNTHRWTELQGVDPDARLDLENSFFQTSHDVVNKIIADSWQLPDQYVKALSDHHSVIGHADASQLSRLLYCSDWMASVFNANNKGEIIDQCRCVLADMFAVSAGDANLILGEIPRQTEQSASMLGLNINQQIDFEEVMQEANIKLAEANLSYQELTWELEKALQERDRLAAELNRELLLAREIQQSFLPAEDNQNSSISGINVSAKQLSGDFFDYFSVDENKYYFNLGDVSGKGMNAAILMAKTCSLFRCLGKRVNKPSEMLSMINDEICETSVRGMFVTMICGLYEPKTGNLRIINAGNPPALFFNKQGKIRLIEAKYPPLGVLPGLQFEEQTLNLNGGSLYLYSDGVTEGHISQNVQLGLEGLVKMIKRLQTKPPLERLQSIISRFEPDLKPLKDDFTMLLIEEPSGRK